MHFSGSYCLGIVVEDEALARSNSQLDYNFGTCGLLDRVVRRAAEAAEAAAAEAAAAEAVAAAAAALEEKKKEQQKAKNSSAFSSFSGTFISLYYKAKYWPLSSRVDAPSLCIYNMLHNRSFYSPECASTI